MEIKVNLMNLCCCNVMAMLKIKVNAADFKLLPYPPSVVAISALWCSLEELIPSSYNVHLTNIMNLINHHKVKKY